MRHPTRRTSSAVDRTLDEAQVVVKGALGAAHADSRHTAWTTTERRSESGSATDAVFTRGAAELLVRARLHTQSSPQTARQVSLLMTLRPPHTAASVAEYLVCGLHRRSSHRNAVVSVCWSVRLPLSTKTSNHFEARGQYRFNSTRVMQKPSRRCARQFSAVRRCSVA